MTIKSPKYFGENLILKSGHKNQKRGGRVKCVGEHWPRDNWINNDKKEGSWSNYVGEHQTHQHRQKL